MEFTRENYKQLKRPGVYRIFNKTTGKNYVGSSVNLYNRLRTQRNWLVTGKSHNPHLQSDFDIYGLKDFTFEVLALCGESDLHKLEAAWADRLHAVTLGYNYSADVTKPRLGVKASEATLAKMSTAQKIETNKPHRKAISGRTLTEYNHSRRRNAIR